MEGIRLILDQIKKTVN